MARWQLGATLAGTTATQINGVVSGLSSTPIFHYRVIASSNGGVVKGLDQTFTTLPHTPPAFTGYAISTPYQTATTLSVRKILAKASDPEGDAISVTVAGPASAHGGTALLQVGGILYTPPDNYSGMDAFPVTITDALGASVTGTVTVTVEPAADAGGVGANPPVLTTLPDGRWEMGERVLGS